MISTAAFSKALPECLVGFCVLSSRIKEETVFDKLGISKKQRRKGFDEYGYCYKFGKDKSTVYGYFEFNDWGYGRVLGSIKLSENQICSEPTPSKWQERPETPEYIGIGSTAGEVIKAYGQPKYQSKIESLAKDIKDFFRDEFSTENVDTQYIYHGKDGDLFSNRILINKNRVVGLKISIQP